MNQRDWDISLTGRPWTKDEALARHSLIAQACRIEMVDGMLLWNDEDRETLLALLLENVGALRATKLGDPSVWRDAIQALDSA
ncbi:MAG: hypothetical protein E6Q67_13935 [Roseateles sp.]|nr:MAG: hypothetical protein E6Q67_13935 [Roseateles sp.]